MANNIIRAEKWLPNVLDSVFATESKTRLLEVNDKYIDLDFKDAGTVRILSILMDGLSDYYRVNHTARQNSLDYAHDNQNNGSGARDGYARGGVSATWESFKLEYDRAIQIPVDEMDDEETAGAIISNIMTEFIRTKVVPEVDALRFSKIAKKCNATLGNLVTDTIASNTILMNFNKAFEWLFEHEVPEEDQVIFVSANVNTLLLGTTELSRFIVQEDFRSERGITFKLPSYMGRPIIAVPSDRFYTDIVIGSNGYAPASGSKVINYMVCSKKAIIPIVKLNKGKIWGPETQDDFDGYKVNFRIYHDVFIPKNKIVGCYVNVSEVSATTKTAKVDLSMDAGSVQNAFVVNEFYTTPAGIKGRLVSKATAITLGSTVTVDGSTVKEVPIGEDIVDSTNTKLYFAVIDDNNVAKAVSGEITLVKHA